MPNYGFGPNSGSITEFDNMTPRIPDPYPVDYLPYTIVVGKNGSGRPVTMGPPTITWHWDHLSPAQWNILHGQWVSSPDLYIKSRIYTGSVLTFQVFQVIMGEPTGLMIPGPYYSQVVVPFSVIG